MRETSPIILEQLYQNWQNLILPFLTHPVQIQHSFQQLVAAYSSDDRYYHTLVHIQQVLNSIESLQCDFTNLSAVCLAGWFHDVVYDPQRQDNESCSALYTESILHSLNVPQDLIAEVQRLILLTQSHQVEEDNNNGKILLDADLAILGTSPERYQIYVQQIRQEYDWLSEEAFHIGRTQFLQNMLHRHSIYQTLPMQQTAEAQARINLNREFEFRKSHAKV
jgi:predicted metal-dependent HD superfamily phosphohydrolase